MEEGARVGCEMWDVYVVVDVKRVEEWYLQKIQR
jgi:hypothetical protein